jgi:hypothetical protein
MRRGNEPHFVFHNDQLIGVNLSADYCAEHEIGIKDLRQMLKLGKKDGRGFDKSVIMDPSCLFTREYQLVDREGRKSKKLIYLALFAMDGWSREHHLKPEATLDGELRPYGDTELCGAWSDRDLGVLVKKGTDAETHLKEIILACQYGDGMICFGSQMRDNPFERAGLCIMIRSRIPEEWQQAAIEEEDEENRLKRAWEDAGGPQVMEQLKKAGKGWYALGTRIAELDRGDGTKALCSWLNPMEQRLYESCWVTVDDLRDWLNGTGKIVKKK